MSEHSRGLLIVLAVALSAGVYLGIKREQGAERERATRRELPPASSASISSPAVPPPHAATHEEIDRAIALLERSVRVPAGDVNNPWALAHGLVAFGESFAASDGRKAVDVIGGYAEPRPTDAGKIYVFPDKKDGHPVEPHRFLMVKTLLEIGVPLDRKLGAADGASITLGRLVADLRKAAALPVSDADYHHIAWQLAALVEARAREGPDAGPSGYERELLGLALDRLERDQKVVSDYSGSADQAFDEGSPLNRAKRDKSGIYGHSCGGLHLVQAVVLGAARLGGDAEKRRAQKQLGVLLYRQDLERPAYAGLLAHHPDQGLLIRVQQLKFHGHLLETLTLARSSNLADPATEGGQRIERVIRTAAADVAGVARELEQGGVYERLDAIRKEREQTYLDLVGDACHAIRGLRRARELP